MFVGGSLGTAARLALGLALPAVSAVAWYMVIANVVGAFLLGVLLTVLAGTSRSRAAEWRLLLGTGVLGGFTTYSTLAADSALLMIEDGFARGLGLGLLTVITGAVAAVAGMAAASLRNSVAQGGKS